MPKHGRATSLPKRLLLAAVAFLVAFPIFAVLHNLLYALGTILEEIPLLSSVLEYAHVAAFLVAVYACPLGFVLCLIGALVSWLVRRPRG